MTFFSPGLASGSRSSQFNSHGDRGAALGRRPNYAPFANPFFDQASTYTPPSIKSLFGFCRFYYLTHGIINAVITKASEYPVTDLILQHSSAGVVDRWTELLMGTMNYRTHQFEMNLEYYAYGNAFSSISFPFKKKLKCDSCRAEHDALKTRPNWRYINHRFWLTCPKCGQTDFAASKDDYTPQFSEIGTIRWNPENISIFYNETTGRMDYVLDLSADFRSQIEMGRKDLVATTPEIFLQAVKTRTCLVFSPSEVFHMRRPSLSSMSRGWGIPLLMPVLKDAFYVQVMKKSQEAVLLTHLVPQIFLFPQPATAGSDPFCVSPETLVETIDGLRPASEIRIGDHLRSHEGRWRSVEAVVRRPIPVEEKVYRIKVSSLPGFPFEVSEEHPILAAKNPQRRSGRRFDSTVISDADFIEAKSLAVGDFVAYPVHRPRRSDLTVDIAALCPEFAATDDFVYARLDQQGAEIFEYLTKNGLPRFKTGPSAERQAFLDTMRWQRDRYQSVVAMMGSEPTRSARYITINENWARVLGYYASEGHTSQSTTNFSFHAEETEFVAELREALLAEGFDSVVYERPQDNSVVVRVEGVVFAALMRGLCGHHSNQKRIPAVIAEASDEICLEMLRCIYNGDGTFISADKDDTSRVSLKTVSPDLAIEVRRLLLSFGFIAGVSRTEPSDTERAKQPYYQVYCNGAAGDALARLFGWSGFKEGGASRSDKNSFIRDGYVFMRVTKIEEVDVSEVIGFQMAGKTFCVAGVATHNTTVDLSNWRDHIRRELARQRQDPAYYGILPFPIGHQVIGENGRSLLLMPEIQSMLETIVASMGFPVDLVFGHGTYAGNSVNMRMLENFFLSNVHAQHRYLRWVLQRIGAYLNWPVPTGRFKPFRMADDLQRQAYLFQLNSAGKVSDATLLSYADLKVEDETKLITQEAKITAEAVKGIQLMRAEAQGEAQLVMAKYQAQAQAAMGAAATREMQPPSDPFAQMQASPVSRHTPGVALDAVAAALARKIQSLPPRQQQLYMEQLAVQAPEMAQLAQQSMESPAALPGQDPGAVPPPAPGVDMRPMPEVLPPRRPGGV